MGDVTLYIIDIYGNLVAKRIGSVSSTMLAVDHEGEVFTLEHPPNFSDKWRWDGSQWVKAEIEQ